MNLSSSLSLGMESDVHVKLWEFSITSASFSPPFPPFAPIPPSPPRSRPSLVPPSLLVLSPPSLLVVLSPACLPPSFLPSRLPTHNHLGLLSTKPPLRRGRARLVAGIPTKGGGLATSQMVKGPECGAKLNDPWGVTRRMCGVEGCTLWCVACTLVTIVSLSQSLSFLHSARTRTILYFNFSCWWSVKLKRGQFMRGQCIYLTRLLRWISGRMYVERFAGQFLLCLGNLCRLSD